MKKYIALPLALLTATAVAGGADHYQPSTPRLPDGLYAGVGIGANALDFQSLVSGPTSQNEYFGRTSVLGNFFVGYNHDLSQRFNLGLEGFFNYQDTKSTLTAGSGLLSSKFYNVYNFGLKLMPALILGTNVRVFADVGISWGKFKYDTSQNARNFNSPNSYEDFRPAWLAGTGAQVALTRSLSLRGEYMYIDYSQWRLDTPLSTGAVTVTKFRSTANQFIGSLIYSFDG